MKLTLTQRLSIVFAALLLACCGASAWLQIRSSALHDMEVAQSLSRDLATHIAGSASLMNADGLRPDAVRQLFGRLMVVNPSVEVYLLDGSGQIKGDDAPPGHLRRSRVDLAPIHHFIAGDAFPILGDDPRSPHGRKVFSAAPLQAAGKAPAGYIYVVLVGEAHDQLAARIESSTVLRTTLYYMAIVTLLGLVAGLIAFRLITRPLRRLSATIGQFGVDGAPSAVDMAITTPSVTTAPHDEIAALERTFAQMVERINAQWHALSQQDQQRREMLTNISHDLRTPLMSLQGYLETLSLKADTLSEADRKRYLAVALAQSIKVGRLAQTLFELARLEHGHVQPVLESFSLVDVVQDVFQKFELAAEARRIQLRADIAPGLPAVRADLGMIERILTNLLDNAIRHTPTDGAIDVDVVSLGAGKVSVTVRDTGPGIPALQRDGLFERPFNVGASNRPGGFGLLIVQRMLALHHSRIQLVEHNGPGAMFRFEIGS